MEFVATNNGPSLEFPQRQPSMRPQLTIQWEEVAIDRKDWMEKSKIFVSTEKYGEILTRMLLKNTSEEYQKIATIVSRSSEHEISSKSRQETKYGEIFCNSDRNRVIVQFSKSFNRQERVLSFLQELFCSSHQEIILFTAESLHGTTPKAVIQQINTKDLQNEEDQQHHSLFWQTFQPFPLLPIGKIISQYLEASLINFCVSRQYTLTALVHVMDTDDRSGVVKNYQAVAETIQQWLGIDNSLAVDPTKDAELMRHLQAIILAEENSLYL